MGTNLRGSNSPGFIYVRVSKGNETIDPVPIDIRGGIDWPSPANEGDYFVKLSPNSVPIANRTARLMKRTNSQWVEQTSSCEYEWTFSNAQGLTPTLVPYQDNNKKKNQFLYINGELVDKKIIMNVQVNIND